VQKGYLPDVILLDLKNVFFTDYRAINGFIVWASSFNPQLGCTRFRGRCWADIRLSYRPELSGHTVDGDVDGLDIGGQHGGRSVLLHHTQKKWWV